MAERMIAAFVPLVDCAVLVAAREKGFAAAEGFDLTLVREPSWSSLRDHLNLGHVDCAHALAPLPIASSLGVGHVLAGITVPFVLSRGGNTITLAAALADEIERLPGGAPATPLAWAAGLARVGASRGVPLTLGMVHPFSGHNFELRYWLAAAGIHPDHHVRIVAIPPPLMVESLALGHVDGFCVGEPWGSLAVERGIGRIVATKAQIFPRGVEKVLAVRPAVAARTERLNSLLRALASAARWADDARNHRELAELLARPEYVDVPAEMISRSLSGRLVAGGGVEVAEPDFLYFERRAANLPSSREALWLYAQMVRWGQLPDFRELRERARHVFRPDLYRAAVDDAHGSADARPRAGTGAGDVETSVFASLDGVAFDGVDVDDYLGRFSIRTPYADARTPIGS